MSTTELHNATPSQLVDAIESYVQLNNDDAVDAIETVLFRLKRFPRQFAMNQEECEQGTKPKPPNALKSLLVKLTKIRM